MSDKPMTLRERIAELENDLAEGRYGSTMHDAGSAREFVCENLKRHLDETANADAEQARLARIGELVEGLADRGLTVSISDGEAYAGRPYTGEHLPDPIGVYDHTLLDALEALKAKATGGTDER